MTKEIDILRHCATNGRYVTGDPFVIEMGARGLLRDHGPQEMADGDHYFTLAAGGREMLAEWRAAQPVVKVKRRSEVFERWQAYCEAFARVPFSHFWKDIWPNYKFR